MVIIDFLQPASKDPLGWHNDLNQKNATIFNLEATVSEYCATEWDV